MTTGTRYTSRFWPIAFPSSRNIIQILINLLTSHKNSIKNNDETKKYPSGYLKNLPHEFPAGPTFLLVGATPKGLQARTRHPRLPAGAPPAGPNNRGPPSSLQPLLIPQAQRPRNPGRHSQIQAERDSIQVRPLFSLPLPLRLRPQPIINRAGHIPRIPPKFRRRKSAKRYRKISSNRRIQRYRHCN
jgi:hypothetical protein